MSIRERMYKQMASTTETSAQQSPSVGTARERMYKQMQKANEGRFESAPSMIQGPKQHPLTVADKTFSEQNKKIKQQYIDEVLIPSAKERGLPTFVYSVENIPDSYVSIIQRELEVIRSLPTANTTWVPDTTKSGRELLESAKSHKTYTEDELQANAAKRKEYLQNPDKLKAAAATLMPDYPTLEEYERNQEIREWSEGATPLERGAMTVGANMAAGVLDYGIGFAKAVDAVVPDTVNGKPTPIAANRDAKLAVETADKVFAQLQTYNETLSAEGQMLAQGSRIIGYAIPTTVTAILSGGGSTAAASGNLVEKGASALVGMMKSPNFWASAIPTYGTTYYEAKENGATEDEAQLTAVLNGFVGAAIESSGGLQKMPSTKSGVWSVVKSALEEGGEEALQGIAEGIITKAVYDQDKEWYSETDQSAVFNLERTGTEFAWGAFMGGLMSGTNVTAETAIQNINRYSASLQMAAPFMSGENGLTVQDAIDIGMTNAKGTDALAAAQNLQKKLDAGKDVSAYAVGRMLLESRSETAARARAIEQGVLESATTAGVTAEVAETVSMAAVKLDQTVVFAAQDSALVQDGRAGNYDPTTDTVTLNPRVSQEAMLGYTIAHEMTHSAEGTEQLATLEKTVVRMVGAETWNRLQTETRQRYIADGIDLTEAQVRQETLADWVGKNLFKDGFAKAVVDGSANSGTAFVRVLDRVRRAVGIKNNPSARNIAMLERLFMEAVENKQGIREGDVEYAFVGYDSKTGLPIYESNFPKGTLKATKAEHILELIQNVWSKKPIELIITEADGSQRKIEAQFDPHYSDVEGELTDASKLMGGNRHGSSSEKRVTLDLADDYYQIASNATYNYSKDEIGKKSDTHRDVTQWHYFINDILFQEYGQKEATPYRVTINVKERSDGLFVYSFSAEKQNKGSSTRRTLHADVTAAKSNSNAQPNTTVAQNAEGVNTQSMQGGENYSQNALLGKEYFTGDAMTPEARARWMGTPSAADGRVTLSADGYTSSVTADAVTPSPQGEGSMAPMSEAQVVERAVQMTAEGKQKASATTFEGILQELGEEETLKRLYNSQQFDRPTGMVQVEGRMVDAGAYVDAYEQTLPEDPAALQEVIRRLEKEHTAEILKMEEEGTLNDYKSGSLKIDLQLFAARRKWDLLQLEPGEDGIKVRKFWEKRLKGNDEMHSEELLELMAGRTETYDPISNQKTLNKAKDKLMDPKYNAKLLRQLSRRSFQGRLTEVDVAAGIELTRQAYNEGNYEVMMDLIAGLSRRGTELGRAVQAFSMMARMTPEGVLKAAHRTLKAETDYVIGDGADDGLDVLADDLSDALNRLARLKESEIQSPRPDGAPPFTQGGHAADAATVEEPLTVEQIQAMQALTPGKRVSFYDLTDEQIKAFAPLETRLYRELKNKSPFIRRRFGEWRVRDNTPVQIATKKGDQRGVQKNKDTGWDIQVSGKVFNENVGHQGPRSVFATPYLSYINDIVENAVLLDTSTLYEKKSPNSLCMHILYAVADIGEGRQLLKLYVEEMYNPAQKGINHRAYELLNIENQPVGAKGSQQNAVSPVSLSTDNITIADLIELVKKKDSEYNPKTRESLMVDDLAATEGTYLTREDIQKQLEKVIKESTDVPEMVKRYVTKKLRKNDGGLAQRLYEMHRKGQLTSETTRRAMEEALELPTLTNEDVHTLVEMAERVQELADDPVAQANAMDEIYDFLGAKMTVKFGDALQAWRKFAMLANVKTHARNTLSNAAYAGIRKTNDLVSMGLERMLRVPAEQRGAYLGWQNTKHGQDILPAIRKNAELAVLEMQKRGAKYETGTGQLKQHRKFFGKGKVGEFFNNLSGFNSEWLEREDIWFFKPAYIDALGQLMTARGETEITPKLHELAMKRALDATFRADNAISDVLASLKKYQNETTAGKRLFGQAVDVVIPFSKTPANIAVQTVMHTPVGIIKGVFDLHNAVKGKGTKDAATAINTMAKGITGTALTIIGFLLGSAGLFNTGFGKTEKERAADELAGRQENAIIIGDTSITLDWLQPVAAPLIVGASIGQRMREDEISVASVFGAVMDGTDSLFELSMLQSLYDVLGGYDAGASATAASIGENVVSQSIPTLLGQAARSIDPVQRKTAGDSDVETIINQVIAKIPGLTYLLDPELDVWGNEVYRTGKPSGGNAALNVGQQFVLPSNTKTGTGAGDRISEEILRLYDEYGGEVIPTALSRDDAKEMGVDYVEANRDLGGVNRAAVEDFINDEWPYQVQETLPNGKTRNVTKFYSEMTDDERRRVLSRIYKKTKETVKGETDGAKSDQDRYFERLYEEMRR